MRYILRRFWIMVLIGFISFVYFLANTTNGLKFGLNLASYFIPGQLRIEKIEGTLLSPLTLKQVIYKNDAVAVDINSLYLHWSLSRLWNSTLHIQKIIIQNLSIHTTSSITDTNNTNKPFDWEDLKFFTHIYTEDLQIQHLTYTQDINPTFQITNLKLQQNKNHETFFSSKLFNGELKGKLFFHLNKPYTWSIALEGLNINPGTQWPAWPGKLDFAFSIANNQQVTHVDLQKLQGDLRHFPVSGHINLQYGHDQIHIDASEMTIGDNSIKLSGALTQEWNIQWNAHIPNLTNVIPKTKGALNASGKITGPKLIPTITSELLGNQLVYEQNKIQSLSGLLNVSLKPNTNSSLNIIASGIKINEYKLPKLNLGFIGNVTQNTQDYLSHFEVALNHQPYIDVDLSLPKTINTENYLTQSFAAKLNVHLNDFKDIQAFIPGIQGLQGKLQGLLAFEGTLLKPIASGEINLRQGQVKIPAAAITLKNISLNLRADNAGLIRYQGSLESDKGILNLIGSTQLLQPGLPSDFSLKGKRFQIVNLAEYKIWASPNLNFHFEHNTLSATGDVFIPEANINPKDFSDTVTLPDDVVFAGQKPVQASTLLSIIPILQITLSLGDQVSVHYEDLKTLLSGKISITKRIGSFVMGNGELYTVKGTYRAYNKILDIQEGRIIYTGNIIDNPGLNIKATRKIKVAEMSAASNFLTNTNNATPYQSAQFQTVGVVVLGTLDRPNVTLFSDPPLANQKDIISYLVFGVADITQVNGTGGAISNLAAAMSAMNYGGSSQAEFTNTLKKFQSGLGLSELSLGSVETYSPNSADASANGTVQNQSVVLGKKLSPKLFLHTSIGLFNQQPTINLRYLLSKHWSVQSEQSSIDTGADLLYSIERE